MNKLLVLFSFVILAFAAPFSVLAAPASEEESDATAAPQGNEAPMLAELVQQGSLPPLDERIPENPFVVGPGVLITEDDLPDWQPGRYGGTLRMSFIGTRGGGDFSVLLKEPILNAPGISHEGIVGNLVESYEVSDSNKVFTLRLRKGLKWSDGAPVTAEDFLFTYNDVLLNENITPTFPAAFRNGGAPQGEPMKLAAPDDYTVQISFSDPYGSFPRVITIERWHGYQQLLKPKHHLAQFHADYTPLENLEETIEKEGFGKGEWWKLFNAMDRDHNNTERPGAEGFPSLAPWVMTSSSSQVLVFERNPYYHRVDLEGNQLPYIDRVQGFQVENLEAATLKILAGEIDYGGHGRLGVSQVALLKENEQRGGYRTVLLDRHTANGNVYWNFTNPDATWRQVLGDVRFRRALNMGVDREEINETIYLNLGSMPTMVPSEYDPEQANRLLDEMGLDKRDRDGWRIGPDGGTFVVPFETIGIWEFDMIPVSELIAEHWKALGLNTTVQQVDPSLFFQREATYQLKISVIWNLFDENSHLSRDRVDRLNRAWHDWKFSDGDKGEEPPQWVKDLFALNAEMRQALIGSPEFNALVDEIKQIRSDNLLAFPVVERLRTPTIVNEKLGNFPQSGFNIAANFNGSQWFFAE